MKPLRALAWIVLAVAVLVALFPDFLSPYSPTAQSRDYPYAAPGRYGAGAAGGASNIVWLARGEPYRWLGAIPASRRLFTTSGAGRVFLLGSDEFGRDWYSRLCHGAAISLTIAPAAALVALLLALGLGTAAGQRGGWTDALVMRAGEVSIVLPWFYVVVALRAALPVSVNGPAALLLVFAALAVLGAATPARLVRALVVSVRHREFVMAANAAGAGSVHVFRRHLLPFLLPALRTQFLLTVPAFIVTEVTLSFLGLGVAEPTPTWGAMLAPLQQYVVLTSYPWMFAPAAAMVIVCLSLQVVAGDAEPELQHD